MNQNLKQSKGDLELNVGFLQKVIKNQTNGMLLGNVNNKRFFWLITINFLSLYAGYNNKY